MPGQVKILKGGGGDGDHADGRGGVGRGGGKSGFASHSGIRTDRDLCSPRGGGCFSVAVSGSDTIPGLSACSRKKLNSRFLPPCPTRPRRSADSPDSEGRWVLRDYSD